MKMFCKISYINQTAWPMSRHTPRPKEITSKCSTVFTSGLFQPVIYTVHLPPAKDADTVSAIPSVCINQHRPGLEIYIRGTTLSAATTRASVVLLPTAVAHTSSPIFAPTEAASMAAAVTSSSSFLTPSATTNKHINQHADTRGFCLPLPTSLRLFIISREDSSLTQLDQHITPISSAESAREPSINTNAATRQSAHEPSTDTSITV